MMALGEKTLAALEKGIPEGFKAYEKKNQEARSFSLASKARYLKDDTVKSKDRINDLKIELLKNIDKRLGWIERTDRSDNILKYSAKIREEFVILKKIDKKDPAVQNKKKTALAGVAEALKKISSEIAGNNIPAEKYQGIDKADVKSQMTQLAKQQYRSDILKVSISTPKWIKRSEQKIRNMKQVTVDYFYLKAFVCFEESPGSFLVVDEMRDLIRVILIT